MSNTRTCSQCNEDFELHSNKDTRLLCSERCRERFFRLPKSKHMSAKTAIEVLRYEMGDCRNFVNGIKRSIKRIEAEYSDWEDRVAAIESKVLELENELDDAEEKPKEELNFDALDDILKI